MDLNADVFSPVHIEGQYTSHGLLSLPNNELLVAKGNHIYHVSADWTTTLWAGVENGPKVGHRLKASLKFISGMCMTETGQLFISCQTEYIIQTIKDDQVSNYAGDGLLGTEDGHIKKASFSFPGKMCYLKGKIYVTDEEHCVRVIDLATEKVSSLGTGDKGLADGPAHSARFLSPLDFLVTSKGNILISDGHAIRSYDPISGIVSTIAGSSAPDYKDSELGINSRFTYPQGICELPNGDFIIADSSNQRLRYMDGAKPHAIKTIAGDGTNESVDGVLSKIHLSHPRNLILMENGNLVWLETHVRVAHKFVRDSLFEADFSDLIDASKWSFEETEVLKRFGDVEWTAPDAQTTLQLHSAILSSCIDASNISSAFDRINELNYTIEDYISFFQLIYGRTDEKIMKLAHPELSTAEAPFDTADRNIMSIEMKMTIIRTLMRQVILATKFPSPGHQSWLERLLSICLKTLTSFDEIQTLLKSAEAESCRVLNQALNNRILAINNSSLVKEEANSKKKKPSDPGPSFFYNSKVLRPSELLEMHLCGLASGLTLKSTALAEENAVPEPQSYKKEYQLIVASADPSKPATAISVLELILFRRWSFFKRMIQSGLVEANSRNAELPADFPPTLLLALLKFLYGTPKGSTNWGLSPQDAAFALENAAEFGLIDSNSMPEYGFDSFIHTCAAIKEGAI